MRLKAIRQEQDGYVLLLLIWYLCYLLFDLEIKSKVINLALES